MFTVIISNTIPVVIFVISVYTNDPSTIWSPISKTSLPEEMSISHSHLQLYTMACHYQTPYPSIFSVNCLTFQPHLSFQIAPSDVPNPIILRNHLDGIAVSLYPYQAASPSILILPPVVHCALLEYSLAFLLSSLAISS